MSNLEKYLYQLRRIEEHREAASEKEIRKIYKKLQKELQSYLSEIYMTYSEDDMLTYGNLAKAGMDARFLEEVEQRINGITPDVAKEINNTVSQTYEACYDGMRNAVVKAAGNREQLIQAFSTVSAVTPDIIKRAVENPVSDLTLNDTLEKHRKEIIYDIKRNIGVGLSNGDRYTTMAKRISESLDSDYKKSIRIVRTEAHRVRESGYSDAATELNTALKNGKSGYVMSKTWKTMKDERVRPQRQKGKGKKYNHVKMDGVTIPQDELFVLPSSTAENPVTCMCPSQTGVAGHDINCRCYLSYDLVLASELTKVQNGTRTIEKAVEVSGNTKKPPLITHETAEIDYRAEKVTFKDLQVWKKSIGNVTDEEYLIIGGLNNTSYIKNANSYKINKAMRQGTVKELSKENQKTIETLKTVIDRNTSNVDAVLIRKVDNEYLQSVFNINSKKLEDIVDELNAKKVGEKIIEKGFISTSYKADKNLNKNDNVELEIFAPKGTKMFLTKNRTESEIILQANTQFEFEGAVSTEDGNIKILMRVIKQ